MFNFDDSNEIIDTLYFAPVTEEILKFMILYVLIVNWSKEVPVTSNDEFGEIQHSLGHLVNSVKEALQYAAWLAKEELHPAVGIEK